MTKPSLYNMDTVRRKQKGKIVDWGDNVQKGKEKEKERIFGW
jgi:hypothetical protein